MSTMFYIQPEDTDTGLYLSCVLLYTLHVRAWYTRVEHTNTHIYRIIARYYNVIWPRDNDSVAAASFDK